MGVLLNLTKEYFGDTMRREEYVKFNTDKMIPIDMGGSVLWADRDIEVVDGGGWYKYPDYFSGDEVMGMKFKDGWRLPKYKDFFELYNNDIKRTVVGFSKAERSVIFYISDSDSSYDGAIKSGLSFRKKGYYHWKNHKELVDEGDFFERWTSEIGEDFGQVGTAIYGFNVYDDKKRIEEFMKRDTDWYVHSSKAIFLPIRLVKEK